MMKLITILKVSSESGIWICNFLNPFFRVEVFNTLLIRNCVDPKSGYFLSSDITRSSPVLYCEYCIQDGNLIPSFFLSPFDAKTIFPIFPEESWVLRWIQIHVVAQIWFEYLYVWTWKCLNPEWKSCRFKNIWILVDRALEDVNYCFSTKIFFNSF